MLILNYLLVKLIQAEYERNVYITEITKFICFIVNMLRALKKTFWAHISPLQN